MTITATIGDTAITQYTNTAQVEFFNPYQTESSSVVAIRVPTASVVFTKNITTTQSVYAPGDTVSFALNFVNNGPATVTNIAIQDIWPNCLNFG